MKKIIKIPTAALLSFVLLFAWLQSWTTVSAAALTALSDQMSSQEASELSNHTITFTTPSGVDAAETITVTFPAGFTIGSVDNTDIDVTDDGGDLTLGPTASGSTWGAVFSGQILTITSDSGTIGAGSVIVIEIGTHATFGATGDQRITNHATPAVTYAITIAGTFGDTGTITIPVLSDDEVNITAEVGQTLNFAISDTTIGFGTLSSGAARWADGATTGSGSETSAHTLTIGTNATSGYTVQYNGPTLTSGGNTINVATISGDADGTPGSEQFAINLTTSGNATIPSAYQNSADNYSFVASTNTTLASETIASADETLSLYYIANIATLTEAGSYSTNVTYTAFANF